MSRVCFQYHTFSIQFWTPKFRNIQKICLFPRIIRIFSQPKQVLELALTPKYERYGKPLNSSLLDAFSYCDNETKLNSIPIYRTAHHLRARQATVIVAKPEMTSGLKTKNMDNQTKCSKKPCISMIHLLNIPVVGKSYRVVGM